MLAWAPSAPDASTRARAAVAAKGTYWSRAARIARARIGAFLVFALVFEGFNVLRLGAMAGFASPVGAAAIVPNSLYNALTLVTMFAAIVLTEALGLARWRHLFASFAALVLGEAVALGAMALLYGGTNTALVEGHVIVSDTALRDLWLYIGAGMLLVAYFAFRERELAAVKAAQDANTQRATVERATVAARLKVIQARVEPELLFGALSDVRDLYLRDRQAAEALLDDLIAYLRAALPQMRSDASTLGREAALAVAYARVLPAARGGELGAESAVPDDARDLPFPPMVLLPLVRAAARLPVSRITIETDGDPACSATVRIQPAQRPVAWAEADLEAVRAALAHGFGTGASLDVEDDGAVVRWPVNAPP